MTDNGKKGMTGKSMELVKQQEGEKKKDEK